MVNHNSKEINKIVISFCNTFETEQLLCSVFYIPYTLIERDRKLTSRKHPHTPDNKSPVPPKYLCLEQKEKLANRLANKGKMRMI